MPTALSAVLLHAAIPLAAVLLTMVFVTLYQRHKQRKHYLALIKSTLEQQRQIDARKAETFATTVHELRAPLTSIRGALVLLSAGSGRSLDPPAANLVRIATANTGRLVRLIDDLLDLERMDAGAAPLDLHPCALDIILAQAVDTMAPMALESAIYLRTLPHPAVPLLFSGDADRLEQALCNLLSNAIKFSPHGSTVTLALNAEPHALVLRVQDAGRGVPADKLEAIFDRFTRLDLPCLQHHGSGLGLAISRSLVTQHGGTLHAERNDLTSPGRPGITFVLRLPRLAAADTIPDPVFPGPCTPTLLESAPI